MIIGITGTNAAGKGTIVEILEKRGFTHFSARTLLTKECDKRGLSGERHNLITVANDLREQNGPDYVIRSLYEMAKQHLGHVVIESIRSVGEIEFLKTQNGFQLLSVDANQKMRYARVLARKTVTDNISFDEFVAQEKQESTSTSPFKQNITACMKLADLHFQNEGTIIELEAKVVTELNL